MKTRFVDRPGPGQSNSHYPGNLKSSSDRTISRFKLIPLTSKAITFTGGFWAARIENNRRVTLPIEYRLCKQTGRIDSYRLAAGQPSRTWKELWMGDVGKWIEAAAYALATRPDPVLDQRVRAAINCIVQGQKKNGYLHCRPLSPGKRWSNLRDGHELYDAGHMMEAAVAYYEATGRRKLLDAMCRYADLIAGLFGREKGKKRGYCGHPEIELALIKLYRAIGEKRYLKLAQYFVNERGRRPHYYDLEARARGKDPLTNYDLYQAQRPVRELVKLDGHAVRALYLCSGMADVAAETEDASLLAACKRLWRNVTKQRMYITGGVGSSHSGERFTFDYDLPNESAYAETCANIALVFFAQRMLQIEADGQYADVMERALYNGVLSGVSLDGKRFFYVNPLAQHPELFRNNGWVAERQKWFGCACCPPNIARLLAGFGQYVYSQKSNEIAVHIYAQSTARFEVEGRTVQLEQRTEYPWKETVQIKMTLRAPAEFLLALRMPGWCRNPQVNINGKIVHLPAVTRKGYARIRRNWKTGDLVELTLPMPVERGEAHPTVRMNGGQVALQRGPLVYCLEEIDNGAHLNDIRLPRNSRLMAKYESRLLGGAVVITGQAFRRNPAGWNDRLYRADQSKTKSVVIKAIPYFLWNNRKPGEMLVWIRE